jgi:hypothetical protein
MVDSQRLNRRWLKSRRAFNRISGYYCHSLAMVVDVERAETMNKKLIKPLAMIPPSPIEPRHGNHRKRRP